MENVKIYVVMNEEERNLEVRVDVEVYDKVFDNDEDALMMEVEMIIDGLSNYIVKRVRFEKDDTDYNNYIVYLNDVRYEFDFN